MIEFKGTKGKWFPNVISTITIGVNAEIDKTELGIYSQTVCEFILPDTDADYEKERVEREANALLISKAPEMFEMLIKCERILRESTQEYGLSKEVLTLIKEAIA